MKTKIILAALLIMTVAAIVYSCSKQDKPSTAKEIEKTSGVVFTNPEQQMNKRLARRYYDEKGNSNGSSTSSKASTGSIADLQMNVLWRKAYEGVTDSSTFVEVPVAFRKRQSYLTGKKSEVLSKEEQNKILNASFDRLVISKNKRTGKISEYIITYTPSLQYVNQKHGDISNNHFNKIDNEFSGFLMFKDLRGKPLELLQFAKGGRMRKLVDYNAVQKNSTSSKATLVCVEPVEYCNVLLERDCEEGFDPESESWGEINCGEWYVVATLNCWFVCEGWADDGSGSGGGGGGSGGSTTDPYYSGLTNEQIQELIALENDYKDRMTQSELAIYNGMSGTQKLAYLSNASGAVRLAGTFYPNSVWNGNGDAFRHAYFNGINTRDLGYNLAKSLADAHETNAPQHPLESQMDLSNNQIGRDLYSYLQSQGNTNNFIYALREKITNGELYRISNLDPDSGAPTANSTLIPTN